MIVELVNKEAPQVESGKEIKISDFIIPGTEVNIFQAFYTEYKVNRGLSMDSTNNPKSNISSFSGLIEGNTIRWDSSDFSRLVDLLYYNRVTKLSSYSDGKTTREYEDTPSCLVNYSGQNSYNKMNYECKLSKPERDYTRVNKVVNKIEGTENSNAFPSLTSTSYPVNKIKSGDEITAEFINSVLKTAMDFIKGATCSGSCIVKCSQDCVGNCSNTCSGNCASSCNVKCSNCTAICHSGNTFGCINCGNGCKNNCIYGCSTHCQSSCKSGCYNGCKSIVWK